MGLPDPSSFRILNENDPASAPTLPGHGSNNPNQENAVNRQHDSIDADASATLPPRRDCEVWRLAPRLADFRRRRDEYEAKAYGATKDLAWTRNYYDPAEEHAYDGEKAVLKLIASSPASSLEGAAIQIALALTYLDDIEDWCKEHGRIDRPRAKFRALDRLLYSARHVVEVAAGATLAEIVDPDFQVTHCDPWADVDERIAAVAEQDGKSVG